MNNEDVQRSREIRQLERSAPTTQRVRRPRANRAKPTPVTLVPMEVARPPRTPTTRWRWPPTLDALWRADLATRT